MIDAVDYEALRQRLVTRVRDGYQAIAKDARDTLERVRTQQWEAEREFGFEDPAVMQARHEEEEQLYQLDLRDKALEPMTDREKAWREEFTSNWPTDWRRARRWRWRP